MPKKPNYTEEQAKEIGDKLGIDWGQYSSHEFHMGMNVETEHGAHDPETNVTDDHPLMTGKIALAHLKELPDYYTRLEKMEEEGEAAMGKNL